ncbi:hypothetical protein ACFX1Q_035113 [Malus domestica]
MTSFTSMKSLEIQNLRQTSAALATVSKASTTSSREPDGSAAGQETRRTRSDRGMMDLRWLDLTVTVTYGSDERQQLEKWFQRGIQGLRRFCYRRG